MACDIRESVRPASPLLALSVRGHQGLQGYLVVLSAALTRLNLGIPSLLFIQGEDKAYSSQFYSFVSLRRKRDITLNYQFAFCGELALCGDLHFTRTERTS